MKPVNWRLLPLAGLAIGLTSALAQSPGCVDTSFRPGSAVSYDAIWDLAVQPDGKPILAGMFPVAGGLVRHGIARLNLDGRGDPTFDPGTGFSSSGGVGWIFSIALQGDGRIVAVGWFTNFNGTPRQNIARLNPDGSLDISFDPGAGIKGPRLDSVAVQPDGKILIGGAFTNVAGLARTNLARLNADGTADAGFEAQLGGGYPGAFAPLEGGGLLLAAQYDYVGYRILRLFPSGQIDPAYGDTNGPNRGVGVIVVLPEGWALVGGRFTQMGGRARAGVARLNADGRVDAAFDPAFEPDPTASVLSIAVQPDGKYLVAGQLALAGTTVADRIVRLLPNGALDPTFGLGGNAQAGPPISFNLMRVKPAPGGGLFTVHPFSGFNGLTRLGVARLKADGSVDTDFDPGAGLWNSNTLPMQVTSLAPVAGGKLVVAGEFSADGDASRPGLARLNSDGTLDASFVPDLPTNAAPWQAQALGDGKVLVLDAVSLGLTRLLADGSRDPTFRSPQVLASGGGQIPDYHMALLPSGQIIIGSSDVAQVDGQARDTLARLNADGTLDAGYVPNVGFRTLYAQLGADYWWSVFEDFSALRDGRVVAAVALVSRSGQPPEALVRLDAQGALDLGFNTVYFDKPLNLYGPPRITEQADGKLLVAHEYTLVSGVARPTFARVNPDGTLDEAFRIAFTPTSSQVTAMIVQPDGKIILAGWFEAVQGAPRHGLARLFPDGTLDPVFDPGPGVEGSPPILLLALQEDGQLVAGGEFNSYDGFAADGVVRIFGGDQVRVAPPQFLAGSLRYATDGAFQFLVSVPRKQTVVVEASGSLAPAAWLPILTNQATSGLILFTDSAAAAHPRRFYRAVSP